MTAPGRAAFIAGLRMLAGALERDESIPLPMGGVTRPVSIYVHDLAAEQFAAAIAALRGTGWEQCIEQSGDVTWLVVRGHLAGLRVEVTTYADEVCEPIPPQPVIKRKCPALDAVIAKAGSAAS
jgi:hypothetical protein